MFTQERSISVLFGGSFPLLLLNLAFSVAKKRSPIRFEFPFFLNSLTKSYVVLNFYFYMIIFKVLQSMGWWLDTIDSKIGNPWYGSAFMLLFRTRFFVMANDLGFL